MDSFVIEGPTLVEAQQNPSVERRRQLKAVGE
jgi:hypothetical protein